MAPILLLTAGPLHAEEVNLPFPFLEWSVYVLLLFGLVVAIGIFIRRARGTPSEPLGGLLDEAERRVHSVDPETTVTECVRQMNEARIGAMLIMQNERLLGIFTERDAMTRVLGGGLDPTRTKVVQVMTPDPVTVTPSTSLDEARLIVTNRRMRHLPVVDDGKVVGMVSSGDLTQRLVRERYPKTGEA
jgi:CBS domain-containing protein